MEAKEQESGASNLDVSMGRDIDASAIGSDAGRSSQYEYAVDESKGL